MQEVRRRMTIPSDALYSDPVDQFDRRWHDRSYHREIVRAQLRALVWIGGVTIGELLDDRCRSSRFGARCERAARHEGAHAAAAGQVQWGGM